MCHISFLNHTASFCAVLICIFLSSCTSVQENAIILKEQGSFAAGGSVVTSPGIFNPFNPSPEGQTLHGDHAFVFYQIPVNSRKYPLVMWHGMGQFSKTWQSTPDGREGFQNIFLRRHFSVYLIDQPRRGGAGRSTIAGIVEPVSDDQQWFDLFRIGVWPDYFEGVQFARDSVSLDQYFRQLTPNTGPIDIDVNVNSVSALFDKIGHAVLITHSHSGGMGWLTAVKNKNVKAIVSYEPGSGFVFPEGEVPEPVQMTGGSLSAKEILLSDFMLLTKIPIVIYYGDNIPDKPDPNPGTDAWRARLLMARLWQKTVNRYGGDVTVVHLPEIDIKGNTHFPFSDLNNIEIANLLSEWLKEKGLD